jgi:hypothetical protein
MNQEEFRVRHGFWATAEWFDYFKSNRNILEAIDWERGRGLTDDEKLRIFDSIREFQLGESSEGRNLNEFARYYSGKNADPLYYESVKLFIREEQRHSQALGRFMEREGIPKLEKSFVDSVFRNLRRYAGLEISLTVLLVAEIISLVYYRALGGAASSDSLRKICGQILKDERRHLIFHCERLALIRQEYSFLRIWVTDFFQRFLLAGTCLAVWRNHWKVLSKRQSPWVFWNAVWRIYDRACRKMYICQTRSIPMSFLVMGDHHV